MKKLNPKKKKKTAPNKRNKRCHLAKFNANIWPTTKENAA